METINIEELKPILGKNFKDTLIVDPILGPYFIIRYEEGGFGIMKTRRDGKGSLKYRAIAYPSSFVGCLDYIAKEFLHTEKKVYDSIQDYIDTWKKISDRVRSVYKEWNVNLV